MKFPQFQTDSNGLYILTKEAIDYIAEYYLRDFNTKVLKEPQPIDIDQFVLYYLKLDQDFQYLSHNGAYLGMLNFCDTNKLPVYDPETGKAKYISAKADTMIIDNRLLAPNQEFRYRYTVGHEGGHYICHKDKVLNDLFESIFTGADKPAVVMCRSSNLEVNIKSKQNWSEHNWMEWQANYMSSALLMPKSMMLRMYNNGQFIWTLRQEAGGNEYYFEELFIGVVSATFQVSREAAKYRLRNLGLLSPKDDAPALIFG
jgi:Zn-dependent peptidase ImmA (M78 family)